MFVCFILPQVVSKQITGKLLASAATAASAASAAAYQHSYFSSIHCTQQCSAIQTSPRFRQFRGYTACCLCLQADCHLVCQETSSPASSAGAESHSSVSSSSGAEHADNYERPNMFKNLRLPYVARFASLLSQQVSFVECRFDLSELLISDDTASALAVPPVPAASAGDDHIASCCI